MITLSFSSSGVLLYFLQENFDKNFEKKIKNERFFNHLLSFLLKLHEK